MSWSRLLLFFLFALGAYLSYRKGRDIQNPAVDDFYSPPHSSRSSGKRALPDPLPASYSLANEVMDVRDAQEEEEIENILKKISPDNEWHVSLSPEEFNSFIKNASSSGVKIMGEIPALGIIQFSVNNPLQAFPLITELTEQNKISLNSPLRQPVSPRNDSIIEREGFEDSFIQWMGGQTERGGLGAGVKVAILDSGVDPAHPMLAGVPIKQKNFLSSPGVADNSHGTAIASVIAANQASYVGVAPASEILSYRVIDQSGRTDSYTVASAIVSAVQDGADVINLSLGGEEGSEVLRQAISYASVHGVSVVAAVGNEGLGLVNFPAAYDGVIGVTSVGTSGRVSNFSNFGEGVDLAAPGVGVLTAWESSKMGNFTGTSISAAIVSGVIAVERSQNQNLSPFAVEELLKQYSNEAEKPGVDSISGHGVISLARLENKNNPNYSDPALVGYYFDYPKGVNGGTLPFEVMVQNQGNQWLGNLHLEVNFLGMQKKVRIDNLAPGQLRSEKFYLQGAEVGQTLEVRSKIDLPLGITDARPDNNKRVSLLSF